jgi:hypothetical protein
MNSPEQSAVIEIYCDKATAVHAETATRLARGLDRRTPTRIHVDTPWAPTCRLGRQAAKEVLEGIQRALTIDRMGEVRVTRGQLSRGRATRAYLYFDSAQESA